MRPRDAALLDASFAAVAPALFALALAQALALPLWPSMPTLPRWLAGLWVLIWLALSLVLARVDSAGGRWMVSLTLCAGAALVAAGLAFAMGSGLGLVLGWGTIALGLGLGVRLLGRGPTAAWRRHSRAARADLAPVGPRRVAAWPAFTACAGVFVAGFLDSLSPPADPARGAGMLSMLTAFFLLLPSASVLGWYPRAALALWWLGTLGAFAVALGVAAPSTTGGIALLLTITVAVLTTRRFLRRPAMVTAREGASS
jgi:hypothetical protein